MIRLVQRLIVATPGRASREGRSRRAVTTIAMMRPPVEFRPEGQAGAASPHGLSYRITDRGRPSPVRDEALEDRAPVMVRLGAIDLATVDTLITVGVVKNRAEGLRWALSLLREHPAYAQFQQQARQNRIGCPVPRRDPASPSGACGPQAP
jgi:hypothetical protein